MMYFGFWSEMRPVLYIFFFSYITALVFSHLNVYCLQYLMCIDITWQLVSFANKNAQSINTFSCCVTHVRAGLTTLLWSFVSLSFSIGCKQSVIGWTWGLCERTNADWTQKPTASIWLAVGFCDQKGVDRSSCETGTSPHALLPVCLS